MAAQMVCHFERLFHLCCRVSKYIGVATGGGAVHVTGMGKKARCPPKQLNAGALLLFLQLNVHHWILRGVVKSFAYVPVGSVHLSAAFLTEVFHAAGAMWFVGVQIATPVLFATLLIDLTVAFLTKAAPQLPALLFSIPLKSVVGYSVLAIGISLWPGIFEKQFIAALGWSERLLHLAH